MAGVVLFVLITILVLISGLISATYELRDKQKANFFRSLNPSGWIVLVLTLCIMVLSVAQFIYSDRITKADASKRDSIIRVDYAKSVESIVKTYNTKTNEIKKAYDSSANNLKYSYDTSTTNIVKALAEYGLGYNEAQKKIVSMIRDSVNLPAVPILQLSGTKAIKILYNNSDYLKLRIELLSSDAASKNFSVSIKVCGSIDLVGPYISLPNIDSLGISSLSSNATLGIFWNFHKSPDFNLKLIFFYINGTYNDIQGKNNYTVNRIYCLNLEGETTTVIKGETEKKVKAFLETL